MNTRFNFTFLLLALTLALLLPLEALAQGPIERSLSQARQHGVTEADLNDILSLGLTHKLNPEQIAGFVETLDMAAQENLMTAPLVHKIQEGLAKHVPSQKIQSVLRGRLENVRLARELATAYLNKRGISPESLNPEEANRLSETMPLGLSASELMALIRQAPPVDLNILTDAAFTLAALKQAGLGEDQARSVTLAGLEHGLSGSDGLEIARMAKAAKSKGLSADEISRQALETASGLAPLGQMQKNLNLTPEDLQHGPQIKDRSTSAKGGPPGGPTGGIGGAPGSGSSGSGSSGSGSSGGGSSGSGSSGSGSSGSGSSGSGSSGSGSSGSGSSGSGSSGSGSSGSGSSGSGSSGGDSSSSGSSGSGSSGSDSSGSGPGESAGNGVGGGLGGVGGFGGAGGVGGLGGDR